MRRDFGGTFWVIIFIVLSMLASAACGSKINRTNFEKVTADMTEEEVREILGPPTESSGVSIGGFSGTASTWKSDDGTISIQFMNGKVMAKQFFKPGESVPRAEREP